MTLTGQGVITPQVVTFTGQWDSEPVHTNGLTIVPILKSLKFDPQMICSGEVSTGTIELYCPLPPGVALSVATENPTAPVVLGAVTPTADPKIYTFTVTANDPILATQKVNIQVKASGGSATDEMLIEQVTVCPWIKTLTIVSSDPTTNNSTPAAPAFVGNGKTKKPANTGTWATGTVTLNKPVPVTLVGGLNVNLNGTGVYVNALGATTVNIPVGGTTASFAITADQVNPAPPSLGVAASVSAKPTPGEVMTTALTVRPWLRELAFNPAMPANGYGPNVNVQCQVRLWAKAPTAGPAAGESVTSGPTIKVNLTSFNMAVKFLPTLVASTSLTIAGGQAVGNVNMRAQPPGIAPKSGNIAATGPVNPSVPPALPRTVQKLITVHP